LRLDIPVPASLPADIQDRVSRASGPNGFLALVLRGTHPNRAWPLAHASPVVSAVWKRFGLGTIYLGTERDRETGDALQAAACTPVENLAGRTSLRDVLAVCARSAICVSVDSGPVHLAVAAGTPVVALFGTGDPGYSGPWGGRARVVGAAPCGCIHPWCDFVTGPGRCMVAISPDTVLEAIGELLNGG
jgi:ADP-heptose:LPS heptosyltransferase